MCFKGMQAETPLVAVITAAAIATDTAVAADHAAAAAAAAAASWASVVSLSASPNITHTDETKPTQASQTMPRPDCAHRPPNKCPETIPHQARTLHSAPTLTTMRIC